MRRRYPLIADATRHWRGLSRLPGEWLPRAWEDGNPVFFLSSDRPAFWTLPRKTGCHSAFLPQPACTHSVCIG